MGIKEKIESRSELVTETGCRIWLRAATPKGYGVLWRNGKLRYAHRLAWEAEHGPIAEGAVICHRCDTPSCVNPAHLFIGTQKDNVRDCARKGRMRGTFQRGEAHPHAKLTEDDVRAIRNAKGTLREVGDKFRIDHSVVCQIRSGKAWGHVV